MEQTPAKLGSLLFGITSDPNLLMVLIMLLLVVLGMFLHSNVNILLLTSLFLPVLGRMGVDPVHFGICMMTIITFGIMI